MKKKEARYHITAVCAATGYGFDVECNTKKEARRNVADAIAFYAISGHIDVWDRREKRSVFFKRGGAYWPEINEL